MRSISYFYLHLVSIQENPCFEIEISQGADSNREQGQWRQPDFVEYLWQPPSIRPHPYY